MLKMVDEKVNISCHMCSSYYLIGKSGVLMLKGHGVHSLDNAIIFGQIHGHLNADTRWIKSMSGISDISKQYTSESRDLIPMDPNPVHIQHKSSFCIFSTSRVTLSPSHLYEKGLILEFEIPPSCVPSFKGLSGGVSYYCSLSIQSSNITQQIHFPIVVNGSGSSTITSLSNSFSCLVCYPVSSLPIESFYADVSSTNALTDDNNTHKNSTIYNIKDAEHICKIHQKQSSVFPGQDIQLLFDFQENVQNCVAVKVSLVMKETRGDGSRIQDKILGTVVRDTQEAQLLNIHLSLPAESVTTFDCPVFKVYYVIEVEFCLEQNSDSMDNQLGLFDNAFSFLIPITVRTSEDSSDTRGESRNSSEKDKSVIQLAHMCLESKLLSLPVHSV